MNSCLQWHGLLRILSTGRKCSDPQRRAIPWRYCIVLLLRCRRFHRPIKRVHTQGSMQRSKSAPKAYFPRHHFFYNCAAFGYIWTNTKQAWYRFGQSLDCWTICRENLNRNFFFFSEIIPWVFCSILQYIASNSISWTTVCCTQTLVLVCYKTRTNNHLMFTRVAPESPSCMSSMNALPRMHFLLSNGAGWRLFTTWPTMCNIMP